MKITACFSFVLILFISTNSFLFSQSNTDTIKIPVQYRRGTEIPPGYMSYEQKYQGKDLRDEKRRLYPLNQVTTGTGIWTELNPKVPRVDYLGINFVNTDTGWACGDLGTIIKTTDGGQSWNILETNTTTPILKVRSYNGQVVIAAGFNGLILRSTDGGESWSEVTSNLTGDLWGLQMINDTLGWAGGNDNSLARTTDGGATWQPVTTPGYNSDYWWIDFLNENYGFIAANGYVLRTSDGGGNWEVIQAGDSYPLFCIDVIDSLHIAAAGYGGNDYPAKNIYSSDGGNSWAYGGELQAFAVNCVSYTNIDTGYIINNETGLWKTKNRGQSWIIVDSLVSLYMGEFEFQLFKEENIGFDAGTALRIYKADGNLDVWHKSIINDDFSDVFFTSEQKGFVISSGLIGRVYKTTDAGGHWQTASGPSGYFLLFADSLTGFISAASSKIYKTTTAGENWYPTIGINNAIAKILLLNDLTGWAAGGSRIFKTIDEGEDWNEVFYHPSISLGSITFIDSLTAWTANLNARPFKTTDGGVNWIQQINLGIYQSRDVFFKDYLNGFILESNKLYKTTDGGDNFTLIPEITGYSVAAKFRNFGDSTIFIIGYKTYRSLDGGESWFEFSELDLIKIAGLSLLNSGSGYAVGDEGLILRYYDSTYTPVEMTSWTADNEGENVFLKWSTSTELNNKGFEVQRSEIRDQKSGFKGQNGWERLGFVDGNGTTTQSHSYSYSDNNIFSGKYKYRLKQIDFNGSYNYSKEIEVQINPPNKYSLEQNYPNPFNPVTTIIYQLPVKGIIILKIYNTLGQEIETLVNAEKPAGIYKINFDGSNFASGVYICRLVSGSYNESKKLILLK